MFQHGDHPFNECPFSGRAKSVNVHFILVDRARRTLFPSSIQGWFPGNHWVRFLVDAVSQLDRRELTVACELSPLRCIAADSRSARDGIAAFRKQFFDHLKPFSCRFFFSTARKPASAGARFAGQCRQQAGMADKAGVNLVSGAELRSNALILRDARAERISTARSAPMPSGCIGNTINACSVAQGATAPHFQKCASDIFEEKGEYE